MKMLDVNLRMRIEAGIMKVYIDIPRQGIDTGLQAI